MAAFYRYIETTQTNSKLVIPGEMVNKLLGNDETPSKKSINSDVTMPTEISVTSSGHKTVSKSTIQENLSGKITEK